MGARGGAEDSDVRRQPADPAVAMSSPVSAAMNVRVQNMNETDNYPVALSAVEGPVLSEVEGWLVTTRWTWRDSPGIMHTPFPTRRPQMSGSAPAPVPSIRGRFVWHELMTTDVAGAKAFYTKALGWGTQKFDGPFDYTMWTLSEAPIGGLMELPEKARQAGVPPHWLASIGTPNVDETVARTSALGGKVLAPAFDIPNVGRYAVLADPQGAAFAVYTPSMEYPPEADANVGEVSWHELLTTDFEAGFRFYADLFGWEKTTAMDLGPMGTYQMYGRGGREYGGMFNKPADMPAPPHWLLYVRVPDVNTSVEQIKALGGQILNGPMEVPGGDLIAQCLDPQGAAFAIHSKAAKA